MKYTRYITILMAFILLISGFTSCDEESFSKGDFEWRQEPMTFVTPGESKNYVFLNNAQVFLNNEINFTASVLPASDTDADKVIKLEVFAYFYEIDGDETIVHGGDTGKLFDSFTDIPDYSDLQVTVSIDDIYSLFESDLVNTNRPDKLVATDLIQFKWVVTDASGRVTDTRIDCSGTHCHYMFGVEAGDDCPNDLSGVLNYEIIDKGSGATGAIGQTGTVTITRVSYFGEYTIDDCQFGTSWNGSKFPAGLFDQDCANLIILEESNSTMWEITNINGPTCDITYTYYYTAGYDEWATARVTRADGKDWPADLRGEGPYPGN
ncbi:hypothetical protein KEM09_14590 [Carboxylicivirga mesophila]|uniref:Uncharacterized protein n=1 Tax=Carboxylicivirga mesophila TaxID=1166478 RepID=A0ABS5KE87_9BACT|nr:hypothetical protein [Carboxylicivirga mesophila]MBS2212643.1 hypothetical protein [Carboxylicivirga mesophila]